jgi:hypothetical protein
MTVTYGSSVLINAGTVLDPVDISKEPSAGILKSAFSSATVNRGCPSEATLGLRSILSKC